MKYTTIFGLPIVERIVDFDQGSYPLRSDTELNIFCFTASLFHLIVKTWNKNEADFLGFGQNRESVTVTVIAQVWTR